MYRCTEKTKSPEKIINDKVMKKNQMIVRTMVTLVIAFGVETTASTQFDLHNTLPYRSCVSRPTTSRTASTTKGRQPVLFHLSPKRAATLTDGSSFNSFYLSPRKAYFTLATIALKASGLLRARSASTLRLISIPALASLPMSTE